MNKQALTIFDKKLGREVEKLNKMSVKTIEEALKKALKSQRYYVKDGGMFEMAADAPERNGKWAADKAAEMLGDALYHFLSKDLVPIAQKQYQIIEELEAGNDGPRGDLWHRASTETKTGKQAKIAALEARISALQSKVAATIMKIPSGPLRLTNSKSVAGAAPDINSFVKAIHTDVANHIVQLAPDAPHVHINENDTRSAFWDSFRPLALLIEGTEQRASRLWMDSARKTTINLLKQQIAKVNKSKSKLNSATRKTLEGMLGETRKAGMGKMPSWAGKSSREARKILKWEANLEGAVVEDLMINPLEYAYGTGEGKVPKSNYIKDWYRIRDLYRKQFSAGKDGSSNALKKHVINSIKKRGY